jgi:multiple sugar transport system substrate-binding protein
VSKGLRWLSLASATALLFAACSSAASPAPATVAPATAEPATAAPATAAPTEAPVEKVTLTFRTRPDNDAEAEVYKQVAAKVSEMLGDVTVEYQKGGTETAGYQDTIKTEAAAGTAPDVFWIPGTDTAEFATKGITLDLRQYAAADSSYSDADFYPGPMFHLTFDPATGQTGGPLWGLPRDVSTFALYLNLDLIAEAGADDPRELAKNGQWTWAKFEEVGAKVAALGGGVNGYGASSWWGPYGVWLNGAGGGFFNADRSACALDTPESIAGLTELKKVYDKKDFALKYGEDPEPVFLAGKLGMFQNGRWATPNIRTNAKFNWDVVALPDGPKPGGNWLFWGSYAANAKTANPEAAWRVIKALTSPEIQAMVSGLGANIPSRVGDQAKQDFLGFTPPDNNQAFLDGLANNSVAEGPLWAGSWPKFDTVMGAAVAAVVNGEKTIDQFQATVCAEANAEAFGN